MQIRPEQIAAFDRASQAELERALASGLIEAFPRHGTLYPAAAIQALVRLAIEKSARHGLAAQAHVQRYLWLMALLGAHWELDPQAAWAAAAMTPGEGSNSADRIEPLWQQARSWRERVMGPDDALQIEALRSLEGRSVEDLCKSSSRSQRDLLLQLAALYPRKFAEVGERPLYELTRLAVEACRPYELLDRWAVVLIAQLMFLLGAGFLGDPLHAWAARSLQASAGAAVDERLQALLEAARAALGLGTASVR